MQNNITDEQLLDEEITIVPSTLSPGTFSMQVSQRLGIRSLSKRIADAARPNDTNSDCQKVLSYLPQTICVHHISRLQL